MIDRHAALMRDFRWQVPDDFNIARACLHWADDPARIAIVGAGDRTWTYRDLRDDAHRLSQALRDHGPQPQHVRVEMARIGQPVAGLGFLRAPCRGADPLLLRTRHSVPLLRRHGA